jgi:hypothetical protein
MAYNEDDKYGLGVGLLFTGAGSSPPLEEQPKQPIMTAAKSTIDIFLQILMGLASLKKNR